MTDIFVSIPTPTNEESILHDSMNYLESYRKIQSAQLALRLKIFKQSAIAKYGSIDNIKNEGGAPIESKIDIDIIERMINLQTFITIPVYSSTNKNVTHCYTLGLWYYWGLPELVITFEKPIHNIEFINVFTNIIHDELFFMFKNRIVNKSDKIINRIDYHSERESLNIVLDKFDLEFELKRIKQNDYMDIRVSYMMWFHMYYMDAIMDNKKQPKLYPVYRLSINEANYRSACEKIVTILISRAQALDTSPSHNSNDNESNDDSTYSADSTCSTDNDLAIDVDEPVPIELINATEINLVSEIEALSLTDKSKSNIPFEIKKKYW